MEIEWVAAVRRAAAFRFRTALAGALLAVAAAAPGAAQPDRALRSMDLRSALLELARRAYPAESTGPARAQLDVCEIELRERLLGLEDGESRARALVDYFFKTMLFASSEDLASPDNFYVHRVLATKQGYCLSLSAIILAVGRRLGLPIHGVAAPRHFFLRWDDGRFRANIETTEGGRFLPDAYYRGLGVGAAAEAEGAYLRNLGDEETIAYLINNEGFIHWAAGDVAAAEARFAEALAIHPRLVEAMINLGVVAGERGDDAAAQARFAAAQRFMPDDVPTWFNRSLSALRSGRYREALASLDEAERRNPGSRHLLQYRQLVLASVLRPETWLLHQRAIVAEGEVLRREGRLRTGFLGRYFADRDLEREALVRVDREIDFEWRWGSPDGRLPSDGFSARWDALVDVPEDGPYSFHTVSNDGVRVWVDGVRIVDDWKLNEGALHQETLSLVRGLHALRIEYFEAERFAGITLRVKRADLGRPLPAAAFLHPAPR